MSLTRAQWIASWVLQIVAAGILFQTLFFKFTGAEESVFIFTTLGAEPWGRIGSGVIELVTVVLLLLPATASIGALLAAGVACGAILSHLTRLGIVVKDDGGLLFGLAVTVLVTSLGVLILRRHELPFVGGQISALEQGLH
jgi:putative oxidoreductase